MADIRERIVKRIARELKDGETCYSVLVPEGTQVVRRDYSMEAWTGPPDDAIGWWQTTVVDPKAGRPHWAPSDVMLNYFERLLDDPAAEDARYVLALLLVRRRILRVDALESDSLGRDNSQTRPGTSCGARHAGHYEQEARLSAVGCHRFPGDHSQYLQSPERGAPTGSAAAKRRA